MQDDEHTRDKLDDLIDAALREEPDIVLPPDFASRVMRRARPRPTFDWAAYVLFPSALLMALGYGAYLMAGPLRLAWARWLDAGAQGALPDIVPLRLLAWAAIALLSTALADRLLGARAADAPDHSRATAR